MKTICNKEKAKKSVCLTPTKATFIQHPSYWQKKQLIKSAVKIAKQVKFLMFFKQSYGFHRCCSYMHIKCIHIILYYIRKTKLNIYQHSITHISINITDYKSNSHEINYEWIITKPDLVRSRNSNTNLVNTYKIGRKLPEYPY